MSRAVAWSGARGRGSTDPHCSLLDLDTDTQLSGVRADRDGLQQALEELQKINGEFSAETELSGASASGETRQRNEEQERRAGDHRRLRDQLQESQRSPVVVADQHQAPTEQKEALARQRAAPDEERREMERELETALRTGGAEDDKENKERALKQRSKAWYSRKRRSKGRGADGADADGPPPAPHGPPTSPRVPLSPRVRRAP